MKLFPFLLILGGEYSHKNKKHNIKIDTACLVAAVTMCLEEKHGYNALGRKAWDTEKRNWKKNTVNIAFEAESQAL